MGQTLLIVDDHATFRSFARALLDVEGFDVIGEADDGESAIVSVRLLRPEVVLLDVGLPDLDGFAVCEVLTEGGVGPAVVMMSARDGGLYRRRLERSRAKGFIAKVDLSGSALSALIG